ncbi:hypothetical protein FRACYDRAFT_278845 [Fragilariopsis cylindrus CCMP1102]|uniref:Uncharacterized protein n=1 Tax=Fragilariopsis cylindrus CCMP1102 TaxID=635003 RepID=A0A1E7EJM6_9STRA|nr:hypothetical protein FRACYDRAFT_278845 [Fragilariopsis cylindrus CCMP1102]|eukprot:OEU06109.1 hypothetical protein FRACYDRAFT_278845 [Fragilariopsis cylindrus CCMP1102]
MKFSSINIHTFLVLVICTIGVVSGVDTCTSEYCVCIGECPDSYTDKFSSSSAIFNGENFVCYATNGIKFGIGGDEVKIGADTVSQSDLGPCSDDIPLPTSAATKAITTSAGASSFSSTSIILSLTVGASIIFGSLIIV